MGRLRQAIPMAVYVLKQGTNMGAWQNSTFTNALCWQIAEHCPSRGILATFYLASSVDADTFLTLKISEQFPQYEHFNRKDGV